MRSGKKESGRAGRDRSGAVLVLAGILLIFGNQVFSLPCSGELEESARRSREAWEAEPQGSLQLAGSSSMERYVSALAEGFMEKYPDVAVTVQFTGSSAGIAAVAGGAADIGISSRNLREEEKRQGTVENLVGVDGIAVCANPANGVEGITSGQLAELYTGSIASWSELKGNDVPVVAIGREAGSGTRDMFERLLGAEASCLYANELDSTGAVLARILSTPGAVGYVSLEAAERVRNKGRQGLVILSLDGVEPSSETVRNGCYPLYCPFFMVTKGEIPLQNSMVRMWFDYIYGEEGRVIGEMTGIVGQ